MRRFALGFLGFTGAFVTLIGLAMLRASRSDGLEVVQLPALSSAVLFLAPIGHMLWIIPAFVAVGVYSRTGRGDFNGDAVWAVCAALLMFGGLLGSLIAPYEHVLFMDGASSESSSVLQWAANLILFGVSMVFVATGIFGRKTATDNATAKK